MSFTSEVKDELVRVLPVCTHCNKATLSALLRIEGTLFISGNSKIRLEIATDISGVGRLAIRLFHEIYGLKTQLTVRRSVLHKTPNYLIEVPFQPGINEALLELGVLNKEGGLERGISPSILEKQCCQAAYIRGAFLGGGFISDPKSDFHFEITVENEELAQGIIQLLADHDIHAKIMQRRNSYMVYLKSGNAISEFLAFSGAHQSALKLESERVIKSIRNDVNRKTNAELANQTKSTNAAFDQLFSIRKVVDHYGIENIPPALKDFIRLRVNHPDASLKELGEYSNPPLSKSAVYHRVRRIEQLAAQIDGGSHG